MKILLDASAILAWLHQEPGAELVTEALTASSAECLVTAANHAEVIGRCLDRGVAPDDVGPMLAAIGYRVIDVLAADGELAGRLRTSTRPYGLSLGDRLCLAVALRLGCPILTADRPWQELAQPLGLDIRIVRP